MAILDPDGNPIEAPVDVELTMPTGGSMKLHFGPAGGTLQVDDEARVRFGQGEWILLPVGVWANTLARALAFEGGGSPPGGNRAARRRRN